VTLKTMICALTLIACPAQAATLTPKPISCVTAPELRAGLAFAMQEVMVAVGSKCGPLLSETSYLRTKGSQLVARYADAASEGTETLNNLVKRLGPDLKIADGDPVAMKGVVTTMIANGLGKILSNKSCADVDKALSLLDPMPPENMIGLIEFAVQKYDESERAKGARAGSSKRPVICPVTPKAATKSPDSLDRN
jgi:hypothetical protein